jgi:hypothetical protein
VVGSAIVVTGSNFRASQYNKLRGGNREISCLSPHLPGGLLQFTLIFSGAAFGRIVADTSSDVSPRDFIITTPSQRASGWCFWTSY